MGSDAGRRARVHALVAALVVLGVLGLVRAASAGPVAMLGGGRVGPDATAAEPSATPSARPSPRNGLPTYRQITRGDRAVVDLSWVGQLVAYTVLLVLLFVAYRLLRAMWRNRWRRPEKPVEVDFASVPGSRVRVALARDGDAQLAAVERGGPRDGVVACWLRLEEVVAASGVETRPAETSSELATRVLQSLDVDPLAVAELAALYREARFSAHPMGEPSRARARTALQRLHEDLAATEVPS